MKKELKTWSEPALTEFGDVESLTLATNKTMGTGDMFTFNNEPTKLSG